METKTLQDGSASFQVSLHEASKSAPVVVFAAGAGGHPERYLTLLQALAQAGCTVIAPHFERLTSPAPTQAELACRARRICLAVDEWALPGQTVTGVGHSIGAACLVALAGGTMSLRSGERVGIPPDRRLARLALLAPPTDFFRAPGALDALQASIGIWVGSQDGVTPAAQAEWLAQAVRESQTVAVRLTEGAGHFSFMDLPPPQTVEPLPDKQAFLERYSSEVCEFLVRP